MAVSGMDSFQHRPLLPIQIPNETQNVLLLHPLAVWIHPVFSLPVKKNADPIVKLESTVETNEYNEDSGRMLRSFMQDPKEEDFVYKSLSKRETLFSNMLEGLSDWHT